MNKLYLHFAKTGNYKNASPIALALLSDSGEQFYAEFSDYQIGQVTTNVKDKVLRYTVMGGYAEDEKYIKNYHYGLKKNIKEALENWLMQFENGVQIIVDADAYDFMMFIDMFGALENIPTNVAVVSHDLNVDIAKYRTITEVEAAAIDLEELVTEMGITIDVTKGNALFNVFAFKGIDEKINTPTSSDGTGDDTGDSTDGTPGAGGDAAGGGDASGAGGDASGGTTPSEP